MSTTSPWPRLRQTVCHVPALGLTLDFSRTRWEDGFLPSHSR